MSFIAESDHQYKRPKAPRVGLRDGLPVGLLARLDKYSPVLPTKTPLSAGASITQKVWIATTISFMSMQDIIRLYHSRVTLWWTTRIGRKSFHHHMSHSG